MSSLSGKNIRDITNLYESMYVDKNVVEEKSIENYSDEELLEAFTEEIIETLLLNLHEEGLLSESAYLEEAPGGPNLLQRITGLGVGIRKASPATRQAGKQRGVRVATELNVKPPKVRQSARTGEPIEYAQGVLGDTRRRITDFVAGGLTTALAGTPVGQEILKRGWGGLKGMASGVMNPDGTKPKPEVKAEDDPFAALRKKK